MATLLHNGPESTIVPPASSHQIVEDDIAIAGTDQDSSALSSSVPSSSSSSSASSPPASPISANGESTLTTPLQSLPTTDSSTALPLPKKPTEDVFAEPFAPNLISKRSTVIVDSQTLNDNNNHNTNSNNINTPVQKPTTPQAPSLRNIRGPASRGGISEYIHKRQLKASLFLIAFVIISHLFVPPLRSFTSKCLLISYVTTSSDGSVYTSIGPDDVYFVTFWIVVLTFLRALFVDNWLILMARQVFGIKSFKITARFAEQSYALITYGSFFAWGAVLLSHSPYLTSVQELWRGWPHNKISIQMKAFYLVQLASWLQQIYVINIEERRKDHYQMFTHHIVTCALIIGSYYYYFTRVGHVILVLMDAVDIALALAKVLRYTGFQRACDATFVVFLFSWIVLRHGLYNYILYSAYTDVPRLLPPKCYYDEATGELIRCFTKSAYYTFVGLLAILQGITIIWLYMIIRVLIRMLLGDSAVDSRSDEDTDTEHEKEKKEK
ncbi:uncharacterized protein SAPINGB_P000922 [Magnusiomyces paraingens]|uniref:TLC domain-containing protein n=1 Tax=Magnusiomyces paraingens TaxID=2606893 RepID=A0A5E8B3N6_9ASCO|nr:uncharacterized protein SAPINGB_P000922 [Saprochaete ingens]VVT45850.1 unnamed protein product [Saprochaete ingens]